jgi:hypothetical protein
MLGSSSRHARDKEELRVIRRYAGDKKSIEARSDDNGKTWSVKLFDAGRVTEYTGGTLAEVDDLAAKHGMKLVRD